MTTTMEDILNDIAGTLALIDQAQAHLDATKHLLPPEFADAAQAQIDDRRDLVRGYQSVMETMSQK